MRTFVSCLVTVAILLVCATSFAQSFELLKDAVQASAPKGWEVTTPSGDALVIVEAPGETISFIVDEASCPRTPVPDLLQYWPADTAKTERVGLDYNYTSCSSSRLGKLKVTFSSHSGARGPTALARAFVKSVLERLAPPAPAPSDPEREVRSDNGQEVQNPWGDAQQKPPSSTEEPGSDEDPWPGTGEILATYVNVHDGRGVHRSAGGPIIRFLGGPTHNYGLDMVAMFALDGRDVHWNDKRALGFTYNLHAGGWLGVLNGIGTAAVIAGGGTDNFSSPSMAGIVNVPPAGYLYASGVLEVKLAKCFRVEAEGTLELRSSGTHARRLNAGIGFFCTDSAADDNHYTQFFMGVGALEFPNVHIAGYHVQLGIGVARF